MRELHYILDDRDVIVGTGGLWDNYAEESACPAVHSSAIVGQRLWNFVQGSDVASYVNALLFTARRVQRPVSMLYRCDTPTQPRQFTMTITPMDDLGLKVSHTPVPMVIGQAEPQKVVALNDIYSTEKCSVCCAFKVGDRWVDPYTHPVNRAFPKGVGLCPDCKVLARETVQSSLKSNEDNLYRFDP